MFRENKKVFIALLLGLCLFVFLTYSTLKYAFNADYVQIAGLTMGVFFGLITILMLIGLICLFCKKDIELNIWNLNWRKWSFFNHSASVLALVCFIVSIVLLLNREKQYSSDYVEIALTQVNNSEIRTSGKGDRHIQIQTKEYPKYSFKISGIAFENLHSDYYVNKVKQGDTLFVEISKEAYDKKITKTKSLSFRDKTVNYHFITVCGLKHRDIELLSINRYEHAQENNSIWSAFFFIAVGCYFLYFLYKSICFPCIINPLKLVYITLVQ